MSKAELYALARLKGLGTRAAAREAGFSTGRPSPDARALWKRVAALRETPGLAEAVVAERAKLASQTARLAPATEAHRIWSRALMLLEET